MATTTEMNTRWLEISPNCIAVTRRRLAARTAPGGFCAFLGTGIPHHPRRRLALHQRSRHCRGLRSSRRPSMTVVAGRCAALSSGRAACQLVFVNGCFSRAFGYRQTAGQSSCRGSGRGAEDGSRSRNQAQRPSHLASYEDFRQETFTALNTAFCKTERTCTFRGAWCWSGPFNSLCFRGNGRGRR